MRKPKGFALIELLVVIAIIALLMIVKKLLFINLTLGNLRNKRYGWI